MQCLTNSHAPRGSFIQSWHRLSMTGHPSAESAPTSPISLQLVIART